MGPLVRRALHACVISAGIATAASAFAVSAPGVPGPAMQKAAPLEQFRSAREDLATRIELPPLADTAVDKLRAGNADRFEKRLQIGIARDVDASQPRSSSALQWIDAGSGVAARWIVMSPGAAALRVALDIASLPPSAEVRFAGDGDGVVYGPITAADVAAGSRVWSPVLAGQSASVEIFLPFLASRDDVDVSIAQVSHLVAHPAAANVETLLKAAGACEVDLICLSASDPGLANVGKAVARMTFTDGGNTYLCTGTLLATSAGAGAPYFYTAAHCISTQIVASTLTTHWFYDRPGCNTGTGISSSYVQLGGGATLLFANTTTDASFMQLNAAPPAGVFYAGWDTATIAQSTPFTAVHHPAGDVKKVSLGSMGGYAPWNGTAGSGGDHIVSLWNSISTGVTEGGSSGSGIFTVTGLVPATDYRLRGGLHGGPSSCTATSADLYDYYSRFDLAYPSISQYLTPAGSCTYSLSPSSATAPAGGTSGTFNVTASSGCAWSAISNAAWLTTSSSGTANGTVSYTVAANSGAARSATITVGTQAFTLSQQGVAAFTTSLGRNLGFESAGFGWVESSTGGYPIVTNNATLAHGGSYYAWLGGYTSGSDQVYQDVAIPADATQVSLRFWYFVATDETTTSIAYDTLSMQLTNAVNGTFYANLPVASNLDDTHGAWRQSPAYDLTAYRGQVVRIKFMAQNDSTNITGFLIDDLSITAGFASASSIARVFGISTRMGVLTGDNVPIGGFIIGGSAPKTVVVRARGPSLGVAGALQNPTLTIVPAAGGANMTNDDWGTDANAAALAATVYAPADPRESAIMTTLAPGAYTAIVTGVGGTTGVAIVEVYEVDHPEIPLAAISTRGLVQTGDSVMIGGFIVQGSSPQTVVVRARGPSLAVAGALQDPVLTLVPASGAPPIVNDNWQTDANAAALAASGFAPANRSESALLLTLDPGAYTAIVTGAGGTTGVAIVEVYTQ